ncbi:helix-turn-helix domain-containing protein [Marinobacter subterrani]|uniref:helix-turn-helix domain-containing protein n=1 Tax=Marinobacter subterrani TaxID=1658765 RepID=UPI0023523794|nr:helix-turn-helix domain-containing protein [Marinobacter subterrani]
MTDNLKQQTSGDRLKALRTKAKLTQSRLAIRAGTTSMHIMDLENGSDDFEDKLQSIAQALECNAQWLRTGKGPAMAASHANGIQAKSAASAAGTIMPDQAQNRVISEIIVSLGTALETIDPPDREKITRFIQKLAEHPDKKWDLAMQVSHFVGRKTTANQEATPSV